MKIPHSSQLICLLLAAGSIWISCKLEGSLDRFGDQLIEQFDSEPVKLVEVKTPVVPPDSIPYSKDCDIPVYPVETPPAAYPERLRRKSIEGKATVFFIVDTTGAMLDTKIIYATDTAFAQSLLETVKNWKVSPAKQGGATVKSYEIITIDFLLH